jgi:DNA-binding winged helix-turn-helix (wHTH) protein
VKDDPIAPAPARPVLLFGEFRLDTGQRRLFHNDAALCLGGRALELLVTLAERPGEVLSRRELEARIWPGVLVEDSSLRGQIATLRRTLGKERYIATVPARGYSFVGNVMRID